MVNEFVDKVRIRFWNESCYGMLFYSIAYNVMYGMLGISIACYEICMLCHGIVVKDKHSINIRDYSAVSLTMVGFYLFHDGPVDMQL